MFAIWDNLDFIPELHLPIFLWNTLWWLSNNSKKERIICSVWYHSIFTLVYSAIFILQTTLIWQILLYLSNTKSSHQTFEKSTSLNHNFHLAEIKMVEFDRGLKGTPKSEFLHNMIFYMTIFILFMTSFIILINLNIMRATSYSIFTTVETH